MVSLSLLVACTMSVLLSSTHSWIVRPMMPNKYTLEIKTDLEQGTFSGQVVIYAQCEMPTSTLTLNALKSKLKIFEDKVVVVDNRDIEKNLVEKARWEPTHEIFLIEMKQTLQYGGAHTITIPFEGVLGDGVQDGYFRIKDENGYVAANQFDTLKARSGFPCFDESFMKAEFTVILHRKKSEKTFSSMSLERTDKKEGDDEWVTDVYKPTVKLSPHLVAYAVTNIPLKSTPTCEQRIFYWYKEDSQNSEIAGKFACKQTAEQSKSFATFYDLPPLEESVSKIDVFLHPQFAYSYIGGWGLILSRETPAMKRVWDISDSLLTNARLAYQYFGGIVSYDSARSALIFKALIHYLSNHLLGRDDQSYVAENLLIVDGGMLTNQFVGEFDPERYKFGYNTYGGYIRWDNNKYLSYIEKKDVLLLRMMHYTLGNSVFKKTLRQFYETFKYRYASTEDFWKTLNNEAKPLTEKLGAAITVPIEKSNWWEDSPFIPSFVQENVAQKFSVSAPMSNLPYGISVGHVMETWVVVDSSKLIHYDYPVIKVTRLNSQAINVKQERFEGNWVTNQKENKGSKMWWIPLTYTTAWKPNFVQTTPTGWIGPMHKTNGVKLYAWTRSSDWIIFNIQHVGLYRVQYEPTNWNLIINALNKKDGFGKIHYMNRVQLVRDVLDFGFLGDLLYDYVFRLLNYLRYEDNKIVWRVFFQHIKNLESAIRRTKHYAKYRENMKTLLTTLFEKTFPDLSWTTIYNSPLGNSFERTSAEFKIIVLKESFSVGVDGVTTVCQEAFIKWKSEGDIPEYKNWVQYEFIKLAISASLSVGNDEDFQFVFKKLTASKNEDKNTKVYIHGFQYTNNEDSIREALDWVFSEDSAAIKVKKSELIQTFSTRPTTFTPVLKYIYSNFDKVKTNTDNDDLKVIIRRFALEMNESEVAELEKFVNENSELNSDEDMKEIVRQGRTGDERRRAWLDANVNSLEEGFSAWKYNIKSD